MRASGQETEVTGRNGGRVLRVRWRLTKVTVEAYTSNPQLYRFRTNCQLLHSPICYPFSAARARQDTLAGADGAAESFAGRFRLVVYGGPIFRDIRDIRCSTKNESGEGGEP